MERLSKRTVTDKGKRVMGSSLENQGNDDRQKKVEERDGFHTSSNKKVPLFNMRLRELEVSIFKGEDDDNPDGWLHRVE